MLTLNGKPTILQKGDLIVFNEKRKLMEFYRPFHGQLYTKHGNALSMRMEKDGFIDVAILISDLLSLSIREEKFNSEHINGFKFV